MRFSRAARPEAAAADLLLLLVPGDERLSRLYPGVDEALSGALKRAEARGFKGSFGANGVLDSLGRVPAERVMYFGIGARDVLDRARLNSALELALRQSGNPLPGRLALAWSDALGPEIAPDALAAATTEAAVVATFREGTLKSDGLGRRANVKTVVLAGFPRLAEAPLQRAAVLGEEVLFARGLVNQPASELFPSAHADVARKRAAALGLAVEVLDERQMRRLGYGAILAVGMGSARPPRMVVVRHRARPARAGKATAPRRKGPLLALVGKGITFDSGGISIKPAADMGYMKGDMGGSAAVLGAMAAIARLGVQADVVGILCLAENMISDRSMRPGDVVRSGSGKTIEVTNTDAEGRMVMADGLHHAVQLGASHVLDIATLTGGQRVALGQVAAHVQGNDEAFTEMLLAASYAGGERTWLMPSFPEYQAMLESPIADLNNSPGRDGQAITAGLFLREFAAGRPWLHVDMAAPSWNRVAGIKDMPKGPSGYGVRLLTGLAERFAAAGGGQ